MPNFTAITELPHSLLQEEQWGRILQRYQLGERFAWSKDVLEVACGLQQLFIVAVADLSSKGKVDIGASLADC